MKILLDGKLTEALQHPGSEIFTLADGTVALLKRIPGNEGWTVASVIKAEEAVVAEVKKVVAPAVNVVTQEVKTDETLGEELVGELKKLEDKVAGALHLKKKA